MGLFGKSPTAQTSASVPVFTVQTLTRAYEPMTTVSTQVSGLNSASSANYEKALHDLGAQAAAIGADAVIGLMFHNQVATSFMAFGTAIKYVD